MPEFDDIKKLWKNADDQISAHESLYADEVKTAITNKSVGITSKLLRSIHTGILSLLLSAALFGYNIYNYAGNSIIVPLSISCLVLSVLMLTYLIIQYKKLGDIDPAGFSLRDILVGKIEYFKRSLNLVHHTIALGIVLLILSINLTVDNNGGNYYVSNVWLDIAFKVIAYFCMIVILKLSQNLYLKQYENALSDLEKSKLTELDAEIRKHRWIRGTLFVIALLVVVAGLFVFYIKANV